MCKIGCSHILEYISDMKPLCLGGILLGTVSKRKAFIYNGSFVWILFSYRRCKLF